MPYKFVADALVCTSGVDSRDFGVLGDGSVGLGGSEQGARNAVEMRKKELCVVSFRPSSEYGTRRCIAFQ